VNLRDEFLVTPFSSLITIVADRTAESQRESEMALDQYVFSYFRKSYREPWIVSQREGGGGAARESETVGRNQFSHFLHTFEGKQRQDAVMSCPTALYCVCHKNTPQGAVPITVILCGGDGAPCTAPANITGARYVTSCTLVDVSKKPAASFTVSM
jgi:hypothetical protein